MSDDGEFEDPAEAAEHEAFWGELRTWLTPDSRERIRAEGRAIDAARYAEMVWEAEGGA